ncbi:hypothetical protein HNY73_015393 [Argiope bruennichi]|uniref:Uncharacterized protein n=1 Tax=Argiope bruennichi TaxID=94029 RepID=A0A8T0ETV9_ARGBR|nr:hypothetical protein HNY73_015393 [Argiope bruennichi]
MTSWKNKKFFKDRASNSFRIPEIKTVFRELVCAGIQVGGGVYLAAYTYNNPTYKILPFMYSAVAIGGAYNVFKILLKHYSPKYIETNRIRTAWELANGALAYSVGVYGFSEYLKQDDEMWIPSLAIAASGYYFSKTAVDDLMPIFNMDPFFLCFQLMSEPVLIAYAATYLIYFQNHEESCIYWLPFVFIGIIGFKIATDGFSKADATVRKLFLFKVIKTMMGSCLFALSSLVLTIYGSMHDFPRLWNILMIVMDFFAAFLIYGSLTCLRRYTDLDTQVFYSLANMTAGPLTILTSCLSFHFVEDTTMKYFIFISLAGLGNFLVCRSVYQFYKVIPRPVGYRRYYERLLGPVMIAYSSLATAWVCYRMDWRFSLVVIPFIPTGMYATYRGYRKN